MAEYLPPRTYNLFNPELKTPFKLSRTGLELFVDCPRCFYLDRRGGIAQPPTYAYTLNSAVDHLLKKEFDIHRKKGTVHPLLKEYGLKAVPFDHQDLKGWRETFVGVQSLHRPTNLLIFGAVDDVWVGEDKKLIVVDFKATSSDRETNLEDAKWPAYFRQMEIYQWLLRRNQHQVSDTGYFVYCNGRKDREAFDGKLEFAVELISHKGKDNWVEKAILDAHQCLTSDKIPDYSPTCNHCRYRRAAWKVENKLVQSKLEI